MQFSERNNYYTRRKQVNIKKIFLIVAPKRFIKMRFKHNMGYKLDTKNPKTLTEKMYCFLLYNRNPIYTICADKVKVREYIKKKLGDEETAKICPYHYFVTDDPETITIDMLPEKFVLKSNHASGHIIICEDKTTFNLEESKKQMAFWLKVNYFYEWGEAQYKNIKPMIICEEILESDITDYRIFCFEGEPQFIRVTKHDVKSTTGYAVGIYNLKWEVENNIFNLIETPLICPKPQNFEQMLSIAKKLSSDFSFVRIDLYEVLGKIYFAELTFTPNGGSFRFKDNDIDLKYGSMIKGNLKN